MFQYLRHKRASYWKSSYQTNMKPPESQEPADPTDYSLCEDCGSMGAMPTFKLPVQTGMQLAHQRSVSLGPVMYYTDAVT
ncbi:hypothetical protein N7528_005742 [Penicillium herquei]|nr:hypothetical protein N7528_005742 [Penicillium herquei]